MQVLASTQGASLFEVCEQATDLFSGKTASALDSFASFIRELQEMMEDVSLPELLELVLEKSGYLSMLELHLRQYLQYRYCSQLVFDLQSAGQSI
jgi:superfamily I DNA/RNA helicase